MRITAFIGAAVLGLAMLALAPPAYAVEKLPEICSVDLLPPDAIILDVAGDVSASCPSVAIVQGYADLASIGGVQAEADQGLCFTIERKAFDFADYRLHVDPGRCLV